MPISEAEKEKSVKFMTALHQVLNIIDELSNAIPEAKYLEVMNNLKILNDNKDIKEIIYEFVNTEVVRRERTRTNMNVLVQRPIVKKHICPFCDTSVIHMSQHQATTKCMLIRKTKRLSALSQKEDTHTIHYMVETMKRLNGKNYYRNLVYLWKNNFNNQ